MDRGVVGTMMVLSLGGCFLLISPAIVAQAAQQQQQQKHTSGQPHGTARTVTPRTVRTVTPRTTRTVTPHTTRTVTPRTVRTVTPRTTRTVTPRTVRTVTPRTTRTVTPRTTRTVTPGKTHVVTPSGAHVVTAGILRGMPEHGAGRATIRGHHFSAWRSGYRVRYHGMWRTFVALSALSAITIGSSEFYPYAYISAPEPYCEGLTEDGCQLMWQEVETTEGDVVDQCVAYCPWQ